LGFRVDDEVKVTQTNKKQLNFTHGFGFIEMAHGRKSMKQ